MRLPARRIFHNSEERYVKAEALDEYGVMHEWELKIPVGSTPISLLRTFHAACRAGSIDPDHWKKLEIIDA